MNTQDIEVSAQTKISKYFCYADVFYSATAGARGVRNGCSGKFLKVFKETASSLDRLREVLGRPITINSWYRNKQVNDAVGGAKASDHMQGRATDITVSGLTPKQVYDAVIASDFPFHKLIVYSSFVHISHVPPGQKPNFLAWRDGGKAVKVK
ncbi:MAG: D-Ala-D-Ala carboxypeptidase family metallohydrolase [Paraclostridium sp.]